MSRFNWPGSRGNSYSGRRPGGYFGADDPSYPGYENFITIHQNRQNFQRYPSRDAGDFAIGGGWSGQYGSRKYNDMRSLFMGMQGGGGSPTSGGFR